MNGFATDAVMESRFLHPGELYAGRRPLRLKTILGSCVAITLWHPASHMAGMCHYVLPDRPWRNPRVDLHDCDGRYGFDAIGFLRVAAAATDPDPRQFRVGLFGGARINQTGHQPRGVGASNVALAQLQLQALGFHIDQRDTGGRGARVVQLDTVSGEVLVKYHSPTGPDRDRIVSGSVA